MRALLERLTSITATHCLQELLAQAEVRILPAPFTQWTESLPSPAQAVAIANRLVDDVTILRFSGKSGFRSRERFKERGAAGEDDVPCRRSSSSARCWAGA